jgi:FtsZ-interacting cell division protein YlmF
MDTNNPPARGPQLLVLHPHQLEDAQTLIQAVKRNQTVVLNASSADDGQAHRIDAETFLFTPARARVEQWPLAA